MKYILLTLCGCLSITHQLNSAYSKIIGQDSSEVFITERPLPLEEKVTVFSSTRDSILSIFKSYQPVRSYQEQKTNITKVKGALQHRKVDMDSLKLMFEDIILSKIAPYWYGTPWTFEGHTAIPKSGSIACGYFVSTTLKDAGLNINRYRLAQQSPENEAASLSFNGQVQTYTGESTGEIIKKMESLADGIYFLGFGNNHVGFLVVRGGHLFVLHSNYIDMEGVVIEAAQESVAFSYYRTFLVVPLSNNQQFLNAWSNGETVKVVTT